MKKPAKNGAVKKKKIVQTFPNFLSKEDWDTSFFEYLQRPKWGYGHASTRKTPVSSFCSSILGDDGLMMMTSLLNMFLIRSRKSLEMTSF